MGNIQALMDVFDDKYLNNQIERQDGYDKENLLVNTQPTQIVAEIDPLKQSTAMTIKQFNSQTNKTGYLFKSRPSWPLSFPKRINSNKQLPNLLQSIPEIDYPPTVTNGRLSTDSNFLDNDKDSCCDNSIDVTDCETSKMLGNIKKQKISNYSITSNELDHTFPNAITATKLKRWFQKDLEIDLPFMDDGQFYDGCWYYGNNDVLLYLPDVDSSVYNPACQPINQPAIVQEIVNTSNIGNSNLTSFANCDRKTPKRIVKKTFCGCIKYKVTH